MIKKIALIGILVSLTAVLSSGCKKEKEEKSGETDVVSVENIDTVEESKGVLEPVYGVRRIKVNNIGPLGQVFNDSNYQQLESARNLGIEPITDIASAYFIERPIVKITSGENYKIDSLTHSLPYLVPEAAALLNEIGKDFKDSLAARGGDSHLIKVTSLLRTPESVSRLRRININATDSSTHQYATTFDISYVNFYCQDSTRLIHQGDLKNLLAEVLQNLRQQGRCLVKYERKTGCFHVTVLN